MITHWRIFYYTGEGEYETRNILIDNEEYKTIQKTLSEGADFVFLKDRPTIKRSMIASITDATQEMEHEKRMYLELPNTTSGESLKLYGEFRGVKESHNSFYKRMGWLHNENCTCKQTNT